VDDADSGRFETLGDRDRRGIGGAVIDNDDLGAAVLSLRRTDRVHERRTVVEARDDNGDRPASAFFCHVRRG
jgi:hypothetical protein